MSATAIVALLQSALLLLGMAQSTPNLPQTFRDNAISVAQNAITQATSALAASSTISIASTASTTNQTFTTPSGAVIGVNGAVLSTPTPVALTNNNGSLSLSLGTVSTTDNSAYISWTTNIPTDSKIFITQMPVASNQASTQVIPSSAGLSTQHFVNISLLSGTAYSYTIEAISGTQDQELTGTLVTTSSGSETSAPQSDPTPLALTSQPTEYALGPTEYDETVNFSTNYPTIATIQETAPAYSYPRTWCTDSSGLSENHSMVCSMPGYGNAGYYIQATDASGAIITAPLKPEN